MEMGCDLKSTIISRSGQIQTKHKLKISIEQNV